MSTLRPRTCSSHRPNHIPRSQIEFPKGSSQPSTTISYYNVDVKGVHDNPWRHMAETYAWVMDQEVGRPDKHPRTAEDWIVEQQIFSVSDEFEPSRRGKGAHGQTWEELVYSYEVEANRWMRHEEEVRQMAAAREKEKARIVQDELRRIETRVRQRRDTERRRVADEKARMFAQLRDREIRERARSDRATIDAWRNYEDRWAKLATSSKAISFSSIPWPLVSPPNAPSSITPAGIILFLFSPLHSQGQTRKERIRSAQLRWHPDRFRRLMGRVADKDKDEIEEGVGIVARCLNDLMSRETKTGQRTT